jgi:hypothetical protein
MQMTFGKRVAAIVTLVAIPAFNFWQEASYLPSQNEVSLETVLKAEPIAIADKSRHWLISGTVRNPSNVRASIVVSDLVACRWVDEVDRSASSIMDERGNTNCKKLERPLGRGWIDAGAQLEFSDTVPASEDRPLLGLRFSVAYARGDRLRTIQETSRDASSRERGRCSNVTVVRLQERSRLRSLALEPKFLMDADTNSDGGLNYFVAAQRDLKCPVTHDRELKDYYSLTELKVFSTDWLPARVQPTPVSSGSG